MSLCKASNCNFVFPILETECLGNSLSAINYNFRALDVETCNTETLINTTWNSIFVDYATLSAKLTAMLNIVVSNSACWQTTYTTVSELSSFWLKPITLVYPFPFTDSISISTIQTWLNANFPAKSGNCFNFIVGQEIYIHCPEYLTIQRTFTGSAQTAARIIDVPYSYTCDCIGRGSASYFAHKVLTVPGSSAPVTSNLSDMYINKIYGFKFVLDSSFSWSNGVLLF